MKLFNFLTKEEELIIVDIGSTTIKAMEISNIVGVPQIINLAISQVKEPIFSNNVITKPEYVSREIRKLLDENDFSEKRIATVLPGQNVFTKIIKLPKTTIADLNNSVQFEAARYLHDNSSSLKVDYSILGEKDNFFEILLVVVRSNILDSFVDCFSMCGLETAVVDVEYYSIQNAFELIHPELVDETICLINIGARYSAVNICKSKKTLYSGTIATGGNVFTTTLATNLSLEPSEAERIKKGELSQSFSKEKVHEALFSKIDSVALDFNRQLGLFWNSAGIEGGIDRIFLSGGGSLTPGLLDKIAEKTGVKTQSLDFTSAIKLADKFDYETTKELAPILNNLFGLSCRKAGDKDLEFL